jgi:hypothetical protein
MSSHGRFATAINCIDGRTQEPVIAYLKEHYNVDYVDMITGPGIDGCFCTSEALQDQVKKSAQISIEKHGSAVIAIAGHAECAGNPVDEGHHCMDVSACMETVRSWKLPVTVIGLFVKPMNGQWIVKEVQELVAA